MSRFLLENSLATKSSVTLFTPDPAQANTRPKIKIADSELPLVRSPKIQGVYLDTLFSFNNHCVQVANRVSKRNNVVVVCLPRRMGRLQFSDLFSQNCQFHHRRLESLEHLMCLIYILLSTTVSHFIDLTDAFFLYTRSPFFCIHFHFASTLCMCVMYLTSI